MLNYFYSFRCAAFFLDNCRHHRHHLCSGQHCLFFDRLFVALSSFNHTAKAFITCLTFPEDVSLPFAVVVFISVWRLFRCWGKKKENTRARREKTVIYVCKLNIRKENKKINVLIKLLFFLISA